MEGHYAVFSANLCLFILLIIMRPALGHGLGTDQASSLMALRRLKMESRGMIDDEKWTEMSVNSYERMASDVGNMEYDMIKGGLPGQPLGKMFKQYAGYVNVDEKKGRSLFYYFAEAAEDPSSKPLILWLNGGPGCSSLGLGAMVEVGPFGVNPDGKTLYSREFAWNRVANTLFLESPAGVGFSYSNKTLDYELSGDKRTAEDAYTFLINWFKRFPHYRTRDFYISGESYAGYYIPELADVIVNRNKKAHSTSKIQLKGIMIGNGIMNEATDAKGLADFLWSHALISDETYQGLTGHCKPGSSKCGSIDEAEIGDLDFYNIYAPLCSSSFKLSNTTRKHVGYDPCESKYVYSYLNLHQVQKALHANRTKLSYNWELCSAVINYWKDSPSTMFPIYRRLMASGLRILLFSGDVDAVVSVTGTRYSIGAMNLKVIKPWRPWLDETFELAGYRVVYDGLTFATVRGAGHQILGFDPCSDYYVYSYLNTIEVQKVLHANVTEIPGPWESCKYYNFVSFSHRYTRMEVEVMIPSPPVEFNFDSASTSPYITAPSSPQRFGTFFYSAPTSPTRISALYSDFNNCGAAATVGGDTSNNDDTDFAFDFSGHLEKSSLSADELFDGGKIKPSPSLQYENKPPDSPKSARSPKKFSPRHRKKEFDPFTAGLKQTRKENIQESSRRTKSLTPFRVSDLLFDADNNQAKNSSALSSSSSNSSIFSASSWYRKWKIKDFLLFRSASESRATELKKYQVLKKSRHQDHDMIKNCSFRSTDSVGSGSSRRRSGQPSISAHELHYTVNRAVSEEMKKRTYLPYKQGLLGCLGFNPSGSLSRG
ncbi:Serine carboxypeptidase-like 40 [Abeliophyllum distichum]|uniref:Carboxypeptidase n=1 Tax=Abeliophyllum distichum TaxID=126358 RepID=A0ABD1THF4_9LAMI